jgi:homoserine acetyltransferase
MVIKRPVISKLVAVGGGSMGLFQSVAWGINFQDVMSGLIVIVPVAGSDHHFVAASASYH